MLMLWVGFYVEWTGCEGEQEKGTSMYLSTVVAAIDVFSFYY